ncbi:MAG TPA: SusC/RagA family TonB-linked outer membrane protein [Cyclobacteriaceae bacterium]|jgi:TonB-linked SusC/RagA family outer membrane protein
MKRISVILLTSLCLLLPLTIFGQERTVTGKVTDGKTGEGLPGVNVLIKGTSSGTITDIDGNYRINLSNENVTLAFSFIGYLSQEIQVGSSNAVDVSMSEDITSLEEVVISGLASTVKRSNLASSVASISADQLAGMTNQSTLDGALYGKLKGANITASSGAPGGGYSIRMRGLTSINGSNEPLIILDGVYLDNSEVNNGQNVVSLAAAAGNPLQQDQPSNRLADINPDDIESVEILKGASAAAIYGSRASGGVIIITTKKGKQGKTQVELSQAIGQTSIMNPLGVRTFDATKVTTHFGAGEVANFNSAVSSGQLHDYEDELFGNKGLLLNSRITISGGSENTSYFLGFSRKDDEGIIKNTGYEKNSFRLNVDHKVTDWLSLNASTNYVLSSADRGFFGNDNSGTTMGIALSATPPWAQLQPDANGNYPNNPYAASNFLQTRDLMTNNETINRFILGGQATARIINSSSHGLRLILQGGIDYYNMATTVLFPNTLQFQKDGNGLGGVSAQGNTESNNKNYSAFLVHDFFPAGSPFTFTTQVGITFIDFDRNTIRGTASNMNGSQTNLDQAGSQSILQDRVIQHDRGFFVQEDVNFRDAIIVSLGVRGDKSSNNGDPNKLFYYPKASLAANIHEFVTFPNAVNQLKLRAAFGQAGNFAVFGDKFTSFAGAVIDGNSGIVIGTTRGNSEVEPERQTEVEFGFDAAFMSNKVALDFTYYVKTVTDLLLTADLPTSSGFASIVTNAAEMQNKGFEIGLLLNLVNTSTIKWTSSNNFWRNTSEVTKLDVPSYTSGGFADFLGQYRIKQGHSPTEIIGVGATPDEDGLVVFGDAQPDFEMSFLNTVEFKGFELNMLWHWKQGGELINLTALLTDLGGTSPDYDKIDLDPSGVLGNGDYRLGELGSNSGPYIENAGYARMREIGLYYNIPKSLIGPLSNVKVGFSGNNLLNFFEYRSYDPEVSNFGGKGLSTGVEVLPFPSSKRWNFHLAVKF